MQGRKEKEMKVGDQVVETPQTFGEDGKIVAVRRKGTVVAIHRRFYVVEFNLLGGKVRECFPLGEKERRK